MTGAATATDNILSTAILKEVDVRRALASRLFTLTVFALHDPGRSYELDELDDGVSVTLGQAERHTVLILLVRIENGVASEPAIIGFSVCMSYRAASLLCTTYNMRFT